MIENRFLIWIYADRDELEKILKPYSYKHWKVSYDEDLRLESDGLPGIEINETYYIHPFFIRTLESVLKDLTKNGLEVYFGEKEPKHYDLFNNSHCNNSSCRMFLYEDYSIKFKIADFDKDEIKTYTSWDDYCNKNNSYEFDECLYSS